MADPSGSKPKSSAARAWNSRLYSTTGGQTVTIRGSEATVAQLVNELVAVTRTASRRIQHAALNIIGFLQFFETFGEAARAFAGVPECEQEQEC